MTTNWAARRTRFEQAVANMKQTRSDGIERILAEAAQLDADASKLLQRARDLRHTARLLEQDSRASKPCCIECDSPEGDVHYGWCSFNGPEAFTVVA